MCLSVCEECLPVEERALFSVKWNEHVAKRNHNFNVSSYNTVYWNWIFNQLRPSRTRLCLSDLCNGAGTDFKPHVVLLMLFLSFYLSLCVCVCVFQDEVDSQNPVLRDNSQLHEEVKGWLKDQKVQEIFMQGNIFKSYIRSILQWRRCHVTELFAVASRSLFIEWLPRACVQTRLSHPVVHGYHYTPRPLQSKHGRYEWPGTQTHAQLSLYVLRISWLK